MKRKKKDRYKIRNIILITIAFLLRTYGLFLILVLHPFWVSIINHWGLDMIDSIFMLFLTKGITFHQYEMLDKILDLMSETAFMLFALFFPRFFLPILIVLWTIRVIGHSVVFITKNRQFYIVSPDVFMSAFRWFYYLDLFHPNASPGVYFGLLPFMLIYKLLQEYFNHVRNTFGLAQKVKKFIDPYIP